MAVDRLVHDGDPVSKKTLKLTLPVCHIYPNIGL